jgi:peptidoglycan/LPS O-acetylase OafA/YrhL
VSTSTLHNKPIYFPGLNALRFIGALTVIIQHIELLKRKFSYSTIIDHPAATKVGEYGVTLFFVLSGFLITYLLLVEKQNYGTIAIKKFYVRRVLRIWPLYYLLIAIAIFVLPNIALFGLTEKPYDGFYQSVSTSAPWYVFMLANVAFVTGNTIAYTVHLWSVACEEQFYLVWPYILKNTNRYLVVFFCFIAGSLLTVQIAAYILYHYEAQLPFFIAVVLVFICKFFYFFRISSMAVGGLGAYIFYFKKQTLLHVIYSKVAQLGSLASVLFVLLYKGQIPFVNHAVLSVFFVILIMNIATNKNTLFKLENKVLNYLGKLSYGFYMYHFIAIALAYYAMIHLFYQPASSPLANCFLYVISIILTIGIAHLSFHFVESPFLNMKKRFVRVKSSDKVLA